jgi:hypothetical protein
MSFTREQFLKGVPFSIDGLVGTYKYSEKIRGGELVKLTHKDEWQIYCKLNEISRKYFYMQVTVFGVHQMVKIGFHFLEEESLNPICKGYFKQ